MKPAQRDMIIFGALTDLLKNEYGTHIKDIIDNYNGAGLADLLDLELINDDNFKKYLIKTIQQMYKKLESRFPESK